jgi:hypothetical protein
MITQLICYAVIVICIGVGVVHKKHADADTIKSIKKYTFMAVVEAQQVFGIDTGKLKHDYVLGRLADAYPDLFKLLNDDEVDVIIAQAKKKLNDMMADDQHIADVVNCLMNDFTQEDKDGTQ